MGQRVKEDKRTTAQERIVKLLLKLLDGQRVYIKDYLEEFGIRKRSLKGDLTLAKFFLSEFHGFAQEIKLSKNKQYYELL